MRKKICFITGTRAEYGLLQPLMKKVAAQTEFQLQIVATGMHLSPEYGLTYQEIEKDGYRIDEKVECLLSSDTSYGVNKSIGIGIIGISDAFQRLSPDLVILLGDRFETFAAAVAAANCLIPIAHLHGGETTEGLLDEYMRHSITKMSYFHFTSCEAYRHRVIQLGEHPSRVFNVGAIGIENIHRQRLLSREELERSLQFDLGTSFAVVTFHPVTLEHSTAEQQMKALLKSLTMFPELKIIFTKANADKGGRLVNQMIDGYTEQFPSRCKAFVSLGQLRYLSAVSHASIVIGNSSSGLIEVPSFHKPTVNIGDRQRGRIHGESVLDCAAEESAIIAAIQEGLSVHFQKRLPSMLNPYEKDGTSNIILSILKQALQKKIDIKKPFYDCLKGGVNL